MFNIESIVIVSKSIVQMSMVKRMERNELNWHERSIPENWIYWKMKTHKKKKLIARNCWLLNSHTMRDDRRIWTSLFYRIKLLCALLFIPAALIHLIHCPFRLSCSLIFPALIKTVRSPEHLPFGRQVENSLLAINGNFLFCVFYNALLNVTRIHNENTV